jgi:GntR family transcriptional repressor for pyruvate dehydrogenase complex
LPPDADSFPPAAATVTDRPSSLRRSLTLLPARLPRGGAERGTTVDGVVKALVDLIRRYRLLPGTPLPSEVQVSAELAVSRGAVREAYRSLGQSGIVEIANGRSPRVGLISSQALLQLVQHALWTQQVSPEEILDLRSAIDEHAAELAAAHRTAADLVALRRAVADMKKAAGRIAPYVRADIAFHETIGRATGNLLIGLVSSGLREAMGASIRVSLAGRQSPVELRQVVIRHERVVDAIEARRPAGARREMVRHYKEARESVRRVATPDAPESRAKLSPRRRKSPRKSQ